MRPEEGTKSCRAGSAGGCVALLRGAGDTGLKHCSQTIFPPTLQALPFKVTQPTDSYVVKSIKIPPITNIKRLVTNIN